jgi:hypothetical protein
MRDIGVRKKTKTKEQELLRPPISQAQQKKEISKKKKHQNKTSFVVQVSCP